MLDDDTRGHFNTEQAKAQIKTTLQGARILILVFGVLGLGVAVATAEKAGSSAAYNAGLLLISLAGCMVIAAGALRGHLALFRLIESLREQEHQQAEILDRVVRAAGDQLSHRRNGH